MAERTLSGVCKKFSANVFDKSKCQNCFKTREFHQEAKSPTSPRRPASLEVSSIRSKTTVKSGNLALATQVSTLPEVRVQKWENVWLVLYSSGVLDWFTGETAKLAVGNISLDDCIGLMNAEVDTSEAFSIGIKTTSKTHYLKAENRLEMDNWCRVLKPFVIASPGYNFNRKSPYVHSFSHQEGKSNSTSSNASNSTKPRASRTVSAPLRSTSSDRDTSPGTGTQPASSSKRWSPLSVKEETVFEDTEESSKKLPAKESKDLLPKVDSSPLEATPKPQPSYSDKYLRPVSPGGELNVESAKVSTELNLQLAEAKKLAKHSEEKAEICSQNLAETKKSLQKANNVISIQKANVASLQVEVESLKANLRNNDEQLEKRLKDLENPLRPCNGSTTPGAIESGFIELQSKLQENEKSLIRRTRELEKANESRAKVAKHTRALLVELETKLKENNQRIYELEEQLLNRTLELRHEKEERRRIEGEKGLAAKEHSKQREITKKSTELLQQAKQDHQQLKTAHKTQMKIQEEIDHFHNELGKKNSEVEKLRGQLADFEKKDGNVREMEAAYKKASEEVRKYETELGEAGTSLVKEKTRCSALENKLECVTVEIKKRNKELNETRTEKEKLKREMEKVEKRHGDQLLLLQEDNETTRDKLQEVEDELKSLQEEMEGNNTAEVNELTSGLEEWKSKLRTNEKELEKLREVQGNSARNYNNEKNKRLELERDLESAQTEVERMKSSQEELLRVKEELNEAKGKLESVNAQVSKLNEVRKNVDETNKNKENERAEKVNELEMKVKTSKKETRELRKKLCESEEKVLSLSEELQGRLKAEEEALGWVRGVERNLTETQKNLLVSRQIILTKAEELNQEKSNIVGTVKQLSHHVTTLESSLKSEKNKVTALEIQLAQANDPSGTKCTACDEKLAETARVARELEDTRQAHREELEKLRESTTSETQALKCQAEEIRLKLTSKVILLQSDISELNAKHDQAAACAKDKHKEAESLRAERDSLRSSDETTPLRERIGQLEEELKEELEENERKINSLKSHYEKRSSDEGKKQNGVANADELKDVQEKHSKEIDALKVNHRKELEENKADMMMVLQALKSDSYTSTSMSNDSMEENEQLQKLEHYVETLQKDHKKEIERLNEEHEHDVQQLRRDMVTLFRVQETYKSPDEGEKSFDSDAVEQKRQLETMRASHEHEMREKDEKHREEVEQLQSDMLVAIQAASASGTVASPRLSSSNATGLDQTDGQIRELQENIAQIQEEFDKERETLHNTIKKAESATKFGLRRNEEMSNKIYQMQREMEEIDTKYQKEIKLYKQAFDQEKIRKTTIGAVPGILAENESLKVKLQELELSMEQMQVRYDAEIKRYKEKFQQENVLTVEELQLKIKSLEDTIAQMRLEHEDELERYTKAVKRGKVSLAGTAKERDLERKIDDLESKVEVMRQKHREEVRKYRERLEDEMERHRKEVSESRSKLRKLEMDNRQIEEFKNKVTDLENKTSKLNKEANKCKDQETELTETKAKNRELQRQIESVKRKVEKFEEAGEENKDPSSSSSESLPNPRNKLSRYSSCGDVSLNSRSKPQAGSPGNEMRSSSQDDVFEPNNNSIKSEIGGYKLNLGLQRPASVSAFPVQADNGTRRINGSENSKKDPLSKRRDSGSTTNRSYQSPSRLLKTSASASNLK